MAIRPSLRGSASSQLPQNPIGRFGQVSGNKIRRRGPLHRVPGELAFSIAGADENTARMGVASELDIGVAIPDHKRASQIESALPGRLIQHASSWLAAVTVFRGGGRAIVDGIDSRARFRELLHHQLMDFVHKRLGKVAAGKAGLIGHHNNWSARLVESPKTVYDSRDYKYTT